MFFIYIWPFICYYQNERTKKPKKSLDSHGHVNSFRFPVRVVFFCLFLMCCWWHWKCQLLYTPYIFTSVYSKRFYNISDSPIKLRDAGKNPTAEKGKFTILGFSSYFFFLFRSLSHAEPVEHERIFFLYQTKRKICCSRASNNNHKKWFHDAERIKLNSSVEKIKKKKKERKKTITTTIFSL